MIFRPELAAKVMAGDKTVTRRRMSSNPRSPWWRKRCALIVGQDYAVQPGRSEFAIGRVVVLAIDKVQLGYLNDDEARCEGFESRVEFERVWKRINGVYRPSGLVWRVEFEVAESVAARGGFPA